MIQFVMCCLLQLKGTRRKDWRTSRPVIMAENIGWLRSPYICCVDKKFRSCNFAKHPSRLVVQKKIDDCSCRYLKLHQRASMPTTVLISGIFITLAFIFYPIGLWSGKSEGFQYLQQRGDGAGPPGGDVNLNAGKTYYPARQ